MKAHVIIQTVAKKLVPFIQLYALYVVMHGEGGPGGGFQGGVILGASFILYVLAFGVPEGKKLFTQKFRDVFQSVGVLIYAGIGVLTILVGGNYLEYRLLPFGSPAESSHLGILGIEIGVGITVAAVMVTIFFEMTGRAE